MNNLRKKSAINTFGELAKTMPENELTLLLAKSDNNYTPEEIEELVEEFYPEPDGGNGNNPGGGDNKEPELPQGPGPQGNPGTSDLDAEVERRVQERLAQEKADADAAKKAEEENKVTPTDNRGKLIKFTKYLMKPIVETVILRGAKEQVIKGYKRVGDPLHTSHIEQRHADLLNSQVRQSNEWYFKEGDAGEVSIDAVLELGG